MSTRWLSQRERGSPLLLGLFTRAVRLLGRRVGRLLLYPIVFYFVLLARAPYRASARYLSRVLERPASFGDVYRHFYTFAAVALDRIFLLTGQHQQFDIKVNNPHLLMQYLEQGRPCILLGAHLGSFEVLRVLGDEQGLRISILMYEENAAKVREVINMLNPELADKVIAIGSADTLLKVRDAADRGELIGILGDRVREGDKSVCCRFLGGEAAFPAGPLALAAVLDLPVVFGTAIYRGDNRYEIFFEELHEHLQLDRKQRQQQLQRHVQDYVQRLEKYCKIAPYNWFNFYNIWETGNGDG